MKGKHFRYYLYRSFQSNNPMNRVHEMENEIANGPGPMIRARVNQSSIRSQIMNSIEESKNVEFDVTVMFLTF